MATVVSWAESAKKSANEAGAEAKQIAETANKASSTMGIVVAQVAQAKSAMEKTLQMEGQIRELRDHLWVKAKKAALDEVPKVLGEMQAKAKTKAEKEAKKQAKQFEADMKKKGKEEGAKAAKVFTDYQIGAGKTAADYAKAGDSLISQAMDLQMNAGMTQSQANQFVTIGDMSEAQRLMQQSRSDMNLALSLNSQATGMYNTANTITAQLPAYAGQAAMASYHADSMYNPDAAAPPPPLVLAQQRRSHVKLLSRVRDETKSHK
jgi:hypothetical protein